MRRAEAVTSPRLTSWEGWTIKIVHPDRCPAAGLGGLPATGGSELKPAACRQR